jgi:hypothetical protein
VTVRAPLQCVSCESIIVTRTQIGHRDVQRHSFPCPQCGITISYILDLDQKHADFKFRPAQNAKWVDSEAGAIATLAFSDEIPVPVDIPDHFSPFVLTAFNFVDRDDYRKNETLRQVWIKSDFPVCERCRIHFERGNWDLFDKESPPSPGSMATPLSRIVDLYNCLQAGFSKFSLNTQGRHQRVIQRLTLARTISAPLYAQLVEYCRSTGVIHALWTEIANIRSLFIENYNALQPLIQTRYWEQRIDVDSFRLSDKRFNPLRQLFIDTFETLCRLMTIAIGVEAIVHHRSLEIPASRRKLTLDDFQALKSSNKKDFIARYPIADLFLDVIDTELRNGVGHHSAHYDADSDLVVLYDSKGARRVTRTMPYTRFCDCLLRLFSAFELAAMYHHSVHIDLGGRF